MRSFFVLLYKNCILVYVCGLFCFGYHQFMSQIPDQLYVKEGENVKLTQGLPIGLAVSGEGDVQTVASIPQTTYETVMKRNRYSVDMSGLTGNCRVTCYLFGIFPIKEIEVNVVESQRVYASGRVIGIYEQTKGVLVLKTTEVRNAQGQLCSPAGNKVMSGDYVTAVEGTEVRTKEELVRAVQESGGKELILSVLRKNELIDISVQPEIMEDGAYLLGIWVKDDVAGIGTLTYYNSEGDFGALGHGIGDGETGELLSVGKGSIYTATLQGIYKGEKGSPGELEGSIYYSTDYCLGNIRSNNELGIYGTLDKEDFEKFVEQDVSYEVEYKQQIHTGKAAILSDISGEVRSYEIEITDLMYQPTDSNKGIHFNVTDPALLKLTGGIVQGMSGSPIIQDGKMVGAVTHVLVNDPAKGYGVFIETMLDY